MPWQIIVHTDIPIIETCYAGIMSKAELSNAVHETLSLAHKHDRTRFLGDCTTLTGGHTIFDLYYLAKEVSSSVNSQIPLKEAVILPAFLGLIEYFNFWETIGINRGFKVRIFRNRESAIEWLLE